ncbi:MAG: peptide ABC transporter substrate-binding protein [Chlamydiales bacterium]
MNKHELDNFLQRENLNLLPAKLLGAKESEVLARICALMRYWPDLDLYPSLLLSLLSFPREFKRIRSVAHLSRLVCADYFYKRKVAKEILRYPHKRHFFVKLLQTELEYPFGSKHVLGMVVVFNLMKHREVFEEQHIIEAVRRIISSVKVIRGSFLDSQDKQSGLHSVYLELENEESQEFSSSEIRSLQKELSEELKGCIEQLVPMTFMRRNEEEVYRNILALRDQLKSVRDIPQATITFEEQTQFDLFFTVVLLRLVKENEPSVRILVESCAPDIVYIPDRIDIVGHLRKNYQKEATVFRLQLPKSQFYRKDRSVNLYKARRHVVGLLIRALGQVRDYNGGLILKQNERLEDFLSIMPKFYDEFLLENFFYSITPIAMQSILPAGLVKEWFLAFSELMDREMSKADSYMMITQKSDDAYIVIVRAEEVSFKEELLRRINQFEIPSLELAFSEIKMNGAFCFGFLYRPSQFGNEYNFSHQIEEVMEEWSRKICNHQVLKISLHETELSLDPRITKADQSYIIIKMLFDGLTRIGINGEPQMAIAQSYKVSSDFKQYTFYLRDSKWSNGAKITAYDFEYSWKKALNPRTHSIYSDTLFIIKNARKAKENKLSLDEVGIRVLDDRTLIVDLEYPAPYFLSVTAHWSYSLINSLIDRKYPGWAYQAGETYVCNGPFRLAEWQHNRAITVEKNPFYWDTEVVKLNKISITMVGREQNEMHMLESGELDIMGRPMGSFPMRGLTHSSQEIKRVSYPLFGIFVLAFNTAQFPFNHKKIRQAFAYAIDDTQFAEDVSHEYGGEAHSILAPALSLHQAPLFPKLDLTQARALFREGLGEIGFVKSDFPRLRLSFCSGMHREPLFRSLVRQWKEAFDIEAHLEMHEWKAHFDQMVRGEYQFGGIELKPLWGDPLHILEYFYRKQDILNLASWEHPKYRTLLTAAKEAANMEERNRFLKEAEEFLADEMPVIPLYNIKGNYLKRKGLKGEYPSEFYQIDFKWAYKEHDS